MLELPLTVVETSDKQHLHARIHKFPKPCRLSTFLIQLVVFQRSFIKSKESEEVGMVRVSLQRQSGNTGSSLSKWRALGIMSLPLFSYLWTFFFILKWNKFLGILSHSWSWTILQHFLLVAYLVPFWENGWFDFMGFIRSYFLWLDLRSNKDLKNRILAYDLLRFYAALADQNMVPS